MQSLLTFGLLEAVVEQHIPATKLIKDEGGTLVMTRDCISQIIHDFVERVRSMMVNILTLHFSVFEPLGADAPSMVCFIALVSKALVNATMVFPPGLARQGFSWSVIWVPDYRQVITKEMVADGWCPSVVEYLVSTFSVSSLEYVRSQGPAGETGISHGDCSPTACAQYRINEETYAPKHASSCRWLTAPRGVSCEYSKPPLEEVKQLVLENEIPVITVVDGSCDGSARLQIHRASNTPYVAISHVWADGLGSTTEKGLPTCQLRWLSSLVSKIQPGAAFWTDGICIPEADHIRKKAIGMMARTYNEAVAVLVLDSGVQLCSSAQPPDEKVLRVLTSGWMRRLWTLQEAVLSKELHLAFADRTLLLTDLMPPPSDMLLSPHLTNLAGELFRLTKLSKHNSYAIGDVARSLRWRGTGKPADETLAIASLLGADASDLVDLGPERRMMRLLQDIGRFPRNILFLLGSKAASRGISLGDGIVHGCPWRRRRRHDAVHPGT
ncbi:putative het domain protein [Rosellinia necatrix]|uniref:Putative het domain protein n=1 Tax=Rosellinia necatrix TaxID=77044 RepID=A0A1W2TT24_ROSNE|nr:putative het domain protein [Rosellinia necatrix]